MKTQEPKIDILRDIVYYHENVMSYERDIANLFSSFSKDVASVAWHNYHKFYTIEINQHFEFEEKIVFPAVLANKATETVKKLIRLLYKQHMEIKQNGAKVFTLFSENKDHVSENAIPLIRDNLLGFAGQTKTHSELENEKLLPIIEKNTRVRFLMGRSFLLYNNEYKKKYARQLSRI
jgi:hemerythrin-like domain-containing protein